MSLSNRPGFIPDGMRRSPIAESPLEVAPNDRSGSDSSSKKAPRQRSRTAHQHPGVWLQRPDSRNPSWRARYVDVSGKRRTVPLEKRDAKTADTRLEFAKKLSDQLQRERSDVKAGLVRTGEDLPLKEALERFLIAHPRLAAETQRSYRTTVNTFAAGREQLTTRQITTAVLAAWRTECVRALRRNTKKGGKRGEKDDIRQLRSPHTVNKDLRNAQAILEYWRSAGMLRLNRDDITACLKKERAPHERRGFLTVDQIKQLIAACERHDQESYAMTREEKAGERERGSTLKYTAVTPLIRCLLLTGMRIGEALALEWKHVVDDQIRIPAEIAKTRQSRNVELDISPSALPGARGEGRLFPISEGEVRAAQKRLAAFGSPRWTPHALRRTSGTFLTCALGIYGGPRPI
jgi:integrase